MRKSASLTRDLALLLILVLMSGCAMVGPKSISAGRGAYAEAINQTEDEQILLSIVKGRYGETYSLLTVNGVAASMRFRAEFGSEVGFGSASRAGENLLLGGFAYEENPTITYSPVQGERYVRELMSPIPFEFLMLCLRSETYVDRIMTLLVARANDLRNPDFLWGGAEASNGDFARFVDLFADLRNSGLLELSRTQESEIAFNLQICDYRPGNFDKVAEFLHLLGLEGPGEEGGPLVIPVYFAITPGEDRHLSLSTRSTFDLVEIMRASVVVPEEHSRAGLSMDYPPVGLAGQGVRIRSSREKPEEGTLAVRHQGYWFFIPENDQQSKEVFNMLRTFWSVIIAGAIEPGDTPVLTLPIGR